MANRADVIETFRESGKFSCAKANFIFVMSSSSTLSQPLLDSNFDSINLSSKSHSLDPRYRSVIDLDGFLQSIYVYWLHHGYWPYVIQQVFQVITLTIVLVVLLLTTCFIDYSTLFSVDAELLDAFTIRAPHPLVWVLLMVSVIGLVVRIFKLRHDLITIAQTQIFLNQVLLISDEQLSHMLWEDVMALLLPIYEQLQGNDHNINTDAMLVRLMRIEQFIIALSKADLLSLHLLHGWPDCILSLPFLGGLWLALTPLLNDLDPLETEAQLKKASNNLRWRVTILGLVGLLLSPFIFVLVLVYYACRYGERVRSSPSFFGTRHWSLRAQWCTRNYNELPHEIRARLSNAEPSAEEYISATVNRIVPALAQFVLFVCSTLCALILAMALVDDELLLHKTFLGRVLVWWLALAASGVAACRMLDVSPSLSRQHNVPQLVNELATQLRVHPEHIRCHLRSYYEHRMAGFMWELCSVVLAPLLFLCVLRHRCDHIVSFIQSHSRVEFCMGRVLSVINHSNINHSGTNHSGTNHSVIHV